jgi:hypothetical protein
MGKLLVRLTVIIVAIYFVISFIVAHLLRIDIIGNWYTTLFALIIAVYAHSEGKYHCKYLKYTATAIFICDFLTRLDNTFNFLAAKSDNLIPVAILALGIGTSSFLAIKHFCNVIKLNRKIDARNARNTR